MQIISLFAGIGGFDLAGHWAGWETVVTCEIAEFPRKVLQYYWPEAYHHDDIHTLTREIIINNSNWKENEPTIVVGGFPCQPYSVAGKRKGKDDDRHLWPEMLRIIREVEPTWVVGENVSGLINWNEGLVFHEVQTDLETAGYEVQPFLLPAVSVNAPHRRDRIWFVARRRDAADTDNNGSHGSKDRQGLGEGNDGSKTRKDEPREPQRCPSKETGNAAPDPDIPGTLRQQENRPLCKDRREVQPHRVQTTKGVDAPGNSDSFSENGSAPHPLCNGHQHGRPGEDRRAQGESQGEGDQRQRLRCDCGGTCEQGAVTDTKGLRSDRAEKHENNNRQGGEWWGRDVDNACKIQERNNASHTCVKGLQGGNEWERYSGNADRIQGRTEERRDDIWGETGCDCSERATPDTSSLRDGEDGKWGPEQVSEGRTGLEFQNQREGQRTGPQTPLADTDSTRRGEECQPSTEPSEQERQCSKAHLGSRPLGWDNFPTTQPTIRARNDGFPPLVDSITFSKWRNESIKAAGNAIVPQVAYQIFKAINEYERLCTKE